MKNRTITVTVSANSDGVFSFLSRLENLPVWATSSFGALWREERQWRAQTPLGAVSVALVADPRTGVIDLLCGEKSDEMALWPMRVLTRPHGTAITATLFQVPGESDEVYDRVYHAWLRDLRGLTTRFGGGEVHAVTRERSAFYPGLVTAKFYETWDFYCAHLGFRTDVESDIFLQLSHPSGAQISILRHEVDGFASELVSAVEGRGLWLNLDVGDVEAEHARLRTAGVPIVAAPEDKPWGERMLIVRDPNGVLVALAHPTTATCGCEAMPLAVN